MAPKTSKCLVIDASIARACGSPDAVFPTSKMCRDFLLLVYKSKHRLAWSKAIKVEWDNHQAKYARRWLVNMFARSQVVNVADSYDLSFCKNVENAACEIGCRSLILKDLHLVCVALLTDKTISSLDDKARLHFSEVANHVQDIGTIVWVNPSNDNEETEKWISAGAKPELARRLVNYRQTKQK